MRDVAIALRLPGATVRRDLDVLAARGLLDVRVDVRVAEETMYWYRPKTADLARYGDLLAQHYVTSRQAVFGFIATPSRLSIKRFAEAFRLRDDEP